MKFLLDLLGFLNRFTFQKSSHERSTGFADRATGTLKTDFINLSRLFINIQVYGDIVSTKWIHTMTIMTCVIDNVEVSRFPIMVKDDLLVKFFIV
jgi:hypothetical protein